MLSGATSDDLILDHLLHTNDPPRKERGEAFISRGSFVEVENVACRHEQIPANGVGRDSSRLT
jgi:hypothetical protein